MRVIRSVFKLIQYGVSLIKMQFRLYKLCTLRLGLLRKLNLIINYSNAFVLNINKGAKWVEPNICYLFCPL